MKRFIGSDGKDFCIGSRVELVMFPAPKKGLRGTVMGIDTDGMLIVQLDNNIGRERGLPEDFKNSPTWPRVTRTWSAAVMLALCSFAHVESANAAPCNGLYTGILQIGQNYPLRLIQGRNTYFVADGTFVTMDIEGVTYTLVQSTVRAANYDSQSCAFYVRGETDDIFNNGFEAN